MATFQVLVGAEKKDKTFPIMIQLYHNKNKKYLPTSHFVSKRQLTRDLKLKDEYVIDTLNKTIVGYRDKLLKLTDINNRSADCIKDFLLKDTESKDIDFIKFGREYIKAQKGGERMAIILNALEDFLGVDTLPIDQLSLKLLNDLTAYLQGKREITRSNHTSMVTYKRKPLSNNSIADYMSKLKQIFSAAMDKYNDEEQT
ncbi:MAG: hypothetical protein JWP44_2447, partial [Mucilaginibacter sp.]|nr:hypothetical protein [Mucilaginibacter sp.]